MKVFISGPMSGIKDFNTPAFNEAEKLIKSKGHSVFNPAWMMFDETWTRKEILPIDIAALTSCDAMYQLPGWENAGGALVEYQYAKTLGLLLLDAETLDDYTMVKE